MNCFTFHDPKCTGSNGKRGWYGSTYAILDNRCSGCRWLIWQRAKRELKKHSRNHGYVILPSSGRASYQAELDQRPDQRCVYP
jgi:hypothetical protein